MRDENDNAIPVYACDSDELEGEAPIGRALTKSQAARMINRFLSEQSGYDPELTGEDILFRPDLMAYLIDQ